MKSLTYYDVMRSRVMKMKLSFRVLNYFLLLISTNLFSMALASAEPITLGLLPSGNRESIKVQSFNLAQKLQDKLNKPVQIYISKNYKGLIDALKTKKVDFAFFSAMTFVESEKETAMKVLLKKTWQGPYYYSALITQKKSGIKSIHDLKNKKIAFVDENSTSGYLYPQVYLRKNKITDAYFKSVTFSGSHAQSIDLLETSKVDVVAVFADDEKGLKGAWTRFSKNKKSQFKIIWTSVPIPNDPIVVRTEFYNNNQKLTHEIMYLLIELQNDPLVHPQVREILGHGDLMPATASQYEPVREMVNIFKASLKL